MEFKEHVARLANGGDPIAAYRCWMRGVEILHSPFIVPTTSELEKFPPTLEALCSQHPRHHTLAASSSCGWSRGIIGPPGARPGNGRDHHRWTLCAGGTVGSPVEAPDVAPPLEVWIPSAKGRATWSGRMEGSWKPSFQVQVAFGMASAIAAHSCYANIA